MYKIICSETLRHQDILGTLFSLNLSIYVYGDIVIYDGNYYLFVLPVISKYLESNLINIRNVPITLEKEDLSVIANYQRKYEKIEIQVSSLRIDVILSKITRLSRNSISEKIKSNEIYLNYNILTNNSYIIKENDIFSIKKYGKYKYNNVVNITKKGNFIIVIDKYI